MSEVMCTSPRLSRYRAIFALEKRRGECHCVLRHSFDLLATQRRSGQVHMWKSKPAQSVFLGHISFEDGTNFCTRIRESYKCGHVFVQKARRLCYLVCPWGGFSSNLASWLISCRRTLGTTSLNMLGASLWPVYNIHLAVRRQTIPPSLMSESDNRTLAESIIPHDSGDAIYCPEQHRRR